MKLGLHKLKTIYLILWLDCSAKCKAEKKHIDLSDAIDQAVYQRSFISPQEGHLG